MRAGSHNMLQSFRFCQLLATSLTRWCAVIDPEDYEREEQPLQPHGAQHLTALPS